MSETTKRINGSLGTMATNLAQSAQRRRDIMASASMDPLYTSINTDFDSDTYTTTSTSILPIWTHDPSTGNVEQWEQVHQGFSYGLRETSALLGAAAVSKEALKAAIREVIAEDAASDPTFEGWLRRKYA